MAKELEKHLRYSEVWLYRGCFPHILLSLGRECRAFREVENPV